MKVIDCQPGTPEWLSARTGIPTASNASKLITSTGAESKSLSAFANKLAGDIFAGKDIDAWEGNSCTQRGHAVEDEARLAYSMRGVPVEQVGFITDDIGLAGCSPDGLVGDDGMLEIKCLPKQHIKALLYFHKNGKAPTDYIAQCQMQMLVAERSYCDLNYYHPDLPSIVIRQYPDPKLVEPLKTALLRCIAERNLTTKILESMT